MAFSTSTHSFFNFKLSSKTAPPLHQPKKKPVTLLLNPRFAPPLLSSCNQCFRANSVTFSNPSTPRHGFSVKVGSQPDYSSGDDGAQSFIPEATQQEEFSWKSVILPFVFPALGGLLFGYEIGATSSATLSLQSPELSGTAWFKLSAIQLGLVEVINSASPVTQNLSREVADGQHKLIALAAARGNSSAVNPLVPLGGLHEKFVDSVLLRYI
ncbi:hypothetical protein ACFX14_006316 [Malus domestica]